MSWSSLTGGTYFGDSQSCQGLSPALTLLGLQGPEGKWNKFGGRLAWDATAICHNNPAFGGRGNAKQGDDYAAAPNIDHSQVPAVAGGPGGRGSKEWVVDVKAVDVKAGRMLCPLPLMLPSPLLKLLLPVSLSHTNSCSLPLTHLSPGAHPQRHRQLDEVPAPEHWL